MVLICLEVEERLREFRDKGGEAMLQASQR